MNGPVKILLLMVLSATVFGRANRMAVPLMPEGSNQKVELPSRPLLASTQSPQKTTQANTSTLYRASRERYSDTPTLLGVEAALLGRRQASNHDYLGHQAFWGGRVVLEVPLSERFNLRPSVGYFMKSETTGAINVTQKHIEGGLGGYYTVLSDRLLAWNVGLSSRFTWAKSTLSSYNIGETSPAEFFYRVGPSTTFNISVSRILNLLLGLEYTWTITSPTRGYSGMSVGFGFSL